MYNLLHEKVVAKVAQVSKNSEKKNNMNKKN